ncbi:MAG: adenylate/guanylate cyclase domain-containing protein [Chloroflexota bacterium]
MSAVREWLRLAADPTILRRSLVTCILVGLVLTVINHGPGFVSGMSDPTFLQQFFLTLLVPFVVVTISSVAAVRGRGAHAMQEYLLLERETEVIGKFPNQNPNPVLRVSRGGRLLFANDASDPILETLEAEVGEPLPDEFVASLKAAAAEEPPRPIELECDHRTFAILPVDVDGFDFLNLYGTEITAQKAIDKFPAFNPNPVMRMSPDGRLRYANAASEPIVKSLGIVEGDQFPDDVLQRIRRSCAVTRETVEVQGMGRIYSLYPVEIRELGFTNLYATDITAMRALDKFPDANPNPVLRVSRAGKLLYANPAAALVKEALGAEIGEELEPAMCDRIQRIAEAESSEVIEVERDGRTWALLTMPVFEFEAVNMYGTEITAVRALELAHRENERLLLNILPESIANRLRGGEMTIADQFDEMTVLFADVVGFTQMSMAMAPNELIDMLNRVFSMCDELSEKYGLEKIKTIGDAYMVVGGLMSHEADEAERVADMGLEMIDSVARYATETGMDLQIRVGLHAGPAVAGVVGIKKFIYDVWGDTVNTASRMESHGIPGRIQVTETTYQRLRGRSNSRSAGSSTSAARAR